RLRVDVAARQNSSRRTPLSPDHSAATGENYLAQTGENYSAIDRGSWILIPGYRTAPTVIGRARRCSSGKSTWTLSHCAWKAAKRPVMVWKRSRTASRWSNPFLRRKSARLLETSSLRRKVKNFSYCLRKAFLK